jgi:hypothetical protein
LSCRLGATAGVNGPGADVGADSGLNINGEEARDGGFPIVPRGDSGNDEPCSGSSGGTVVVSVKSPALARDLFFLYVTRRLTSVAFDGDNLPDVSDIAQIKVMIDTSAVITKWNLVENESLAEERKDSSVSTGQ